MLIITKFPIIQNLLALLSSLFHFLFILIWFHFSIRSHNSNYKLKTVDNELRERMESVFVGFIMGMKLFLIWALVSSVSEKWR